MAKGKLIIREAHPIDRRQVVLKLTAQGQALWSKVLPKYEKAVQEVFGSLPQKRRKLFFDDLETLYSELKRKAGRNDPLAVYTSAHNLRSAIDHIMKSL